MNLRFLQNVSHDGVTFRGPQAAKVDDNGVQTAPAQPGVVVDLDTDQRGLSLVLKGMQDRGLVETTTDPATHNSNLVDAAQYAIPLSANTNGQAPTADAVKASQEAYKQRMAGQQPVTQEQLQQQPAAPQPPQQPAQPPVNKNAQPTAEEIVATADAAA